ncbi:hypothetical protein AC249_AIPGENE18991 [Exaiptasia diaphana]|nr:hypothetical protein AC249_AIPGENE18991 [Exaiptasia diaphana]
MKDSSCEAIKSASEECDGKLVSWGHLEKKCKCQVEAELGHALAHGAKQKTDNLLLAYCKKGTLSHLPLTLQDGIDINSHRLD